MVPDGCMHLHPVSRCAACGLSHSKNHIFGPVLMERKVKQSFFVAPQMAIMKDDFSNPHIKGHIEHV